MFKLSFIQRILQPWQKQQESIRLFPLPCPEHHTTLIPVHQGNGVYVMLCPHCQIASQPVEDVSKLATLKPSVKPDPDLQYVIGKVQKPQQKAQPSGIAHVRMHVKNAEKHMVQRLKGKRMVLEPIPFDGNSSFHDTDSLKFGNALTEHTLPRVKKALPDVG